MERSELNKLIKKRDGLIEYVNKNLEGKIKAGQKDMFDIFVSGIFDKMQTDENGKILNNNFNRALITNIDRVFKDYGQRSGVEVLSAMVSGVNSVLDYNGGYFDKLADGATLLPLKKKVKDQTAGWLGISGNKTTENGYLETLIKAESVKNDIRNFAMRAVVGQSGWAETKNSLGKIIQGDRESLGALEKYHRNFAYDLFSQVDRATSQTYATDLDLEFAIYEGGLIDTSREFCQKRNGQVFHKTEIQRFNPTVARQPNYNPFTDLGGYGCRHTLNYIPESLAQLMRPDANAGKLDPEGRNFKDKEYEGYDDLMKKADQGGPEVQKVINDLLGEYDGYATPLNYKSLKSIHRKVNDELDGDLREVKDAVRATIVLPKATRDKILKVLENDPRFDRVKNQTAEKFSGYSGILTNIKLKSGILAEVQFNTEKMIYAKEKPEDAIRIMGQKRWNEIKKETKLEGGLGHEFYEKMREMSKTDPELLRLDKLSREYYKNFQND